MNLAEFYSQTAFGEQTYGVAGGGNPDGRGSVGEGSLRFTEAPVLARLLITVLLIGAAVEGGNSPLVAQAIPFSCADTVQKALGGFRGAWQVQAIFRNGETGWDTTTAKSTFTLDLHGCVLREDYQGTRYGEPYDFLALWGANGQPEARYQRFFSHSLHGIFGLANGAFEGDTLVLNERITVNNQPLLLQYRFTRPTASSFSQLNRRSTDGGANWIVTLRATYRRQ